MEMWIVSPHVIMILIKYLFQHELKEYKKTSQHENSFIIPLIEL